MQLNLTLLNKCCGTGTPYLEALRRSLEDSGHAVSVAGIFGVWGKPEGYLECPYELMRQCREGTAVIRMKVIGGATHWFKAAEWAQYLENTPCL